MPRLLGLLLATLGLLLLAAPPRPAGAQTRPNDTATNPDFFLKSGIGARPMGLGGAFTAVADDSTSAYWNPAGLALLRNFETFSMHSNRFDFDINYDFLAVAIPVIPGRVLGVSTAIQKTSDIPITKDRIPSIVGYASDMERTNLISYGHKISENAAVGFTYKQIRHDLYNFTGIGSEADFGLLYRPSKVVSFGLNVQDALPSSVEWTTGSNEQIPTTLRGGVAFHIHDWGTLIALDVDKVAHRDPKFNGGFEYQFNDTFVGRAGMNDGNGTAGMSINYKSWRFDYAYLRSELGETNLFSTAYRFGTSLLEKWTRPRRPQCPQCGKYTMGVHGCEPCNRPKTGCARHIAPTGGCGDCSSRHGDPVSDLSTHGDAFAATRDKAKAGASAAGVLSSSANGLGAVQGTVAGAAVSAATDLVGIGKDKGPAVRRRRPMLPQPDVNKVLSRGEAADLAANAPADLGTGTAPRESAAEVIARIREGNQLVLSGHHEAAVTAYRSAVQMSPGNEEAHQKLAGVLQYQKKYGEAADELKEAISANPRNLDNYITVANVYAKLGDYAHAREAAEIVAGLAPDTKQADTARNLMASFEALGPGSAVEKPGRARTRTAAKPAKRTRPTKGTRGADRSAAELAAASDENGAGSDDALFSLGTPSIALENAPAYGAGLPSASRNANDLGPARPALSPKDEEALFQGIAAEAAAGENGGADAAAPKPRKAARKPRPKKSPIAVPADADLATNPEAATASGPEDALFSGQPADEIASTDATRGKKPRTAKRTKTARKPGSSAPPATPKATTAPPKREVRAEAPPLFD